MATRFVAFLRAINVGGHTVTMARLRHHFEELGLAEVETFIASGNVLFTSKQAATTLAPRIEAQLRKALGYEVATFLRTAAEVEAIAAARPFPAKAIREAAGVHVGLLRAPLPLAGRRAVLALQSDIDRFHIADREVYWLCRSKQSQSTFSNAIFERTTGAQATFRTMRTLVRLAAVLAGR